MTDETVRSGEPILSVRDLVVQFKTEDGWMTAVDGLSYDLRPGETLGIVGESGSGKSVTNLAVMGLLPMPQARVPQGEVLLHGDDLLGFDARSMRKLRGNKISMIFQDPMTSLNPFLRVSTQLAEMLDIHKGIRGKEAFEAVVQMLERVGIPDARARVADRLTVDRVALVGLPVAVVVEAVAGLRGRVAWLGRAGRVEAVGGADRHPALGALAEPRSARVAEVDVVLVDFAVTVVIPAVAEVHAGRAVEERGVEACDREGLDALCDPLPEAVVGVAAPADEAEVGDGAVAVDPGGQMRHGGHPQDRLGAVDDRRLRLLAQLTLGASSPAGDRTEARVQCAEVRPAAGDELRVQQRVHLDGLELADPPAVAHQAVGVAAPADHRAAGGPERAGRRL